MGNLSIGTNVMTIKDAVEQVQQNIRDLKDKKSQITVSGGSASKINRFYDEKNRSPETSVALASPINLRQITYSNIWKI
jgi:hypothetical protein